MMRRNRVLYGLLVLGGLLVSLQGAAAGDQPGSVPLPLGHPRTPPPFTDESERSEEFLKEMVSILNETRSSDAFLATVLALHRAKVDGKLVVPAIIRNEERLKVFADTDPKNGTDQQQTVLKCVLLLITGEKVQ